MVSTELPVLRWTSYAVAPLTAVQVSVTLAVLVPLDAVSTVLLSRFQPTALA
jgi:hypothetical protein